jgi:hypothetical protein
MLVTLVAAPVLPDTAVDWELAPVLATEMAPPLALASPVEPESPDPERRPLEEPVEPEAPEVALGAEKAVEEAGPVSPVLVAEDWAVTSPEFPEIAVGTAVTCTSPPSPPLALAWAMELPPTTVPVAEPPTAIVVLVREPAFPE